MIKRNLYLITLLVLSIFAVLPLFHSGFFPMHDNTQVQRVFEMKQSLLDGMLPVRWVKDLGYGLGYPIFNFYAPLPYYVGAIFSILGFDVLLSTKLMILFGFIGAGVSMYFLARESFGEAGGIVSAILYLYAPYHALDLYVRGDIGEIYAYFLIPLIFYGIQKYYRTKKLKHFTIGAFSFAALIISHNLSAMMVAPFVLIVSVFLFLKSKDIKIFGIFILGVMLSAFYAIPALKELGYTNVLSTIGGSADFHNHFVCLNQLWNSPWMFGGSIPGCMDGLSFRLGKIHIIFSVIAFILSLIYFKKDQKGRLTLFSILGLLLSIVLMLSISKSFWEVVPYMSYFQYPWRFLLLASFFSSFTIGYVFYLLSKHKALLKIKWMPVFLVLIFVLTSVCFYSKLFLPQKYLPYNSASYTSPYSLEWTTSKISDEYMPKGFSKPKSFGEMTKNKISGDVLISNLKSNTKGLSAIVFAPVNTSITIHFPYFPFWQVYLSGKKTNFEIINSGLLLQVPAGQSLFVVRYSQTFIEKIADLISLCGIGILIAVIIYSKRKNEKKD